MLIGCNGVYSRYYHKTSDFANYSAIIRGNWHYSAIICVKSNVLQHIHTNSYCLFFGIYKYMMIIIRIINTFVCALYVCWFVVVFIFLFICVWKERNCIQNANCAPKTIIIYEFEKSWQWFDVENIYVLVSLLFFIFILFLPSREPQVINLIMYLHLNEIVVFLI